jgi:hypothetical protein
MTPFVACKYVMRHLGMTGFSLGSSSSGFEFGNLKEAYAYVITPYSCRTDCLTFSRFVVETHASDAIV